MTSRAIFTLLCAIGLLAFLVAGYLILTAPGRERAKADAARASQIVAEGRAAAGADAVAIVVAGQSRDAETDTLTQRNADAIRNAPGADVRLDPGLDLATRRAICLRPSASRNPDCVALLHPRPD